MLALKISEDGQTRLKINVEVEERLNGENKVKKIKALRLEWQGRIMRKKQTVI